MNSERIVLHSDMNAFYASVELLLNPALRGKPVAVCGSTESRHGIVLAKSQLAKQAGVKTGMVNWEARQCCPGLIMVPPHYDEYIQFSHRAQAIYTRYTDRVEPYGMDECWLELTHCPRAAEGGERLANELRETVKRELGLTVSVGVSFNKIFAKLGSDMKKPDAVTVIDGAHYRELIWPLPVEVLLYAGPATTRKLRERGVLTVGDLAQLPGELVRRWLGKNGVALRNAAAGLDTARVQVFGTTVPIQSVGHGITCSADLCTEQEVWKVLLELAQDVGHRLRVHKLAALGVALDVRGSGLGYLQYQTRLPYAVRSPYLLARAALSLFSHQYPWHDPVRALTIRAQHLVPSGQLQQLALCHDVARMERRDRLEGVVEALRARYGKHVIRSACLLGDIKMPDDGRDLVRMPGLMYR